MAVGIKQRHPVAQAYARALLEVGSASGEAELYGDQLDALTEAVESEASFKVFLESPKIRRGDKKEALERALQGKVSDPVLNLVRILIDRDRQTLIEDIAQAYREQIDEVAGRANVTITSAVELSAGVTDALKAAIEKKLNKEVVSTELVDAGLLSGVTIQIGDLVVDGSLRTQLRKVRQEVSLTRFGKDLIDEN
ncbi:MAG: ATP synthase F1 subunit delta [Planctomycetes bacterium]|jgi:F-type H+-transporting ATPase subunit delta|nr:ATP synthase F1 subunit delta [Planctomycetota bacterium]MBT6968744.1 ATP synthase F1 subunit delta [Planctomycetota bacterium]MBT7103773.1 ATP synthase F1 subunit delta [Planctomycetota bacterium]MBT7131492.1 ATP synthase F1 subunit delta [Planctomycetota bacterium]MBT7639120.1 ATP synthase F1 subunit delta [Planctomycetota bacterium]